MNNECLDDLLDKLNEGGIVAQHAYEQICNAIQPSINWVKRHNPRADVEHLASKLLVARWSARKEGKAVKPFNEVHRWAVPCLRSLAFKQAKRHKAENMYADPEFPARGDDDQCDADDSDAQRLAIVVRHLATFAPDDQLLLLTAHQFGDTINVSWTHIALQAFRKSTAGALRVRLHRLKKRLEKMVTGDPDWIPLPNR
jgi:hypothetical protein